MDARHSVPPKVPAAVAVSNTPTVTVYIMKGEGGFGMRISVEGVVTAYSAPGGAAEVRGGRYAAHTLEPSCMMLAGVRPALTS